MSHMLTESERNLILTISQTCLLKSGSPMSMDISATMMPIGTVATLMRSLLMAIHLTKTYPCMVSIRTMSTQATTPSWTISTTT